MSVFDDTLDKVTQLVVVSVTESLEVENVQSFDKVLFTPTTRVEAIVEAMETDRFLIWTGGSQYF